MKIKTNILPQLKAWFIENSKLSADGELALNIVDATE